MRPIHHPKLGRIVAHVVDSGDNGEPYEIRYRNIDGKVVGYWAYGSWDPELPYQGELSEKRPSFSDKIGTPWYITLTFFLTLWSLALNAMTASLNIHRGTFGPYLAVWYVMSLATGAITIKLLWAEKRRQEARR